MKITEDQIQEIEEKAASHSEKGRDEERAFCLAVWEVLGYDINPVNVQMAMLVPERSQS